MIQIDTAACIGCGQCVTACFANAMALEEGKAVYKKPCILCGHCFAICPTGAITMPHLPDGTPEAQAFDPALNPVDPHALLQLVRSRRSIRRFKPEPLSESDLQAILEAGRMSPTGGNVQGLRFILLEKTLPEMAGRAAKTLGENADQGGFYGPTMRAIGRAAEAGGDRLFFHAPQVLLIIRNDASNINDAGIAAGRIELMAAARGAGVCFNGFFARAAQLNSELRADLGIADEETLMLTMALGYPDIHYLRAAPRNPLQLERR